MKNLIMTFVIIFSIISCKVETPLNNSNVLSQYDKYNIDKDTNWVEITDTTRISLPCIQNILPNDLVPINLRSHSDYKSLFDSALTKRIKDKQTDKNDCSEYNPLNVDFDKQEVVGFLYSGGSDATLKCKMYNNKHNNELLILYSLNKGKLYNLLRYENYYKISTKGTKSLIVDSLNSLN